MNAMNKQSELTMRRGNHSKEGLPAHFSFDQKKVNERFANEAAYWEQVYRDQGLIGAIYRHRQQAALRLLDDQRLSAGARVLEIGCGAGYLTVALAARGYFVDAVDSTLAMLQTAERHVLEAGVGRNVCMHLGDAHRLEFRDGEFDVVVALGVLPWLHTPALALKEMHRVLKGGGYLLFTVDNQRRLNHVLDPRLAPWTAPLRKWCNRSLERCGIRQRRFHPSLPVMHSAREIKKLLEPFRFESVERRSVGFGPFTLLGKRILPDGPGKRFHSILQRAADLRVPFLRNGGSHYVILARSAAHHVREAKPGEVNITKKGTES